MNELNVFNYGMLYASIQTKDFKCVAFHFLIIYTDENKYMYDSISVRRLIHEWSGQL